MWSLQKIVKVSIVVAMASVVSIPLSSVLVEIGMAILQAHQSLYIHHWYTPTLTSHTVDHPDVDAVYTWVNPHTPEWIAMRQETAWAVEHEESASPVRFNQEADRPDAELQVSLQLTLKNMPFLRRVYVVTIRPQVPQCMQPDGSLWEYVQSGMLRIVHHDEIWRDDKGQPSFSSHSIEGHLHNIEDLAERFIYLNDDYYILQPTVFGTWFGGAGDLPVGRWVSHSYLTLWTRDRVNLYTTAYRNLLKAENAFHVCKIIHTAIPLTRTLMREGERYYGDTWRRTVQNHYRSPHDIPPIASAVHHGLRSGLAASIPFRRFTDPLMYQYYADIDVEDMSARNLHSVCINTPANTTAVAEALSSLYL